MSFGRMCSRGRKNVSRCAAKTLLPRVHGIGVSARWPTPSTSAAASSPSMTTDDKPRRGISRTPIGFPCSGVPRVRESPSRDGVRDERKRAAGEDLLRTHVELLKPDRPKERDGRQHDHQRSQHRNQKPEDAAHHRVALRLSQQSQADAAGRQTGQQDQPERAGRLWQLLTARRRRRRLVLERRLLRGRLRLRDLRLGL